MANETTNSITISRTDPGFPDYLDFDKLRSGSIEYLSSLTGKVWTDYNVHDPGITILEMLIYALLDLGYRTNLPAVDIFTKNPGNQSPEDNFFTAGQILSCNPLTITDFRKLLIDIDGVKNAWLTVAEDIDLNTICKKSTSSVNTGATDANDCRNYINGLYHIYIERDELSVKNEKEVLEDVRSALQAHRNLCEDFIDITLLCSLDMGVCADIVLEENTDVEAVYRNIIVRLKEFFSPGPVFYTLQQLIDKKKPIEDIFAGRPYNFTQSHGFVDTDEFELITRKKEIHLSDVYNVILAVPGVKTLRRLKLKPSTQDFSSAWQFTLPDNYVPRFSTALSAFNFTANGIYLPADLKKSEAYFAIASGNKGKLMQLPETLDIAIPKTVYHSDLADYYSIQNEFPLVYGIGEGGLPESALPKRKAQALQLKAYLLFFDQLFAGYLSQLQNIRSLFSLREPSAGNKHSYFVNQLNTVPGFSDLVSNTADENGQSSAGKNGSIIAWPVWKKDLDTLLAQENFTTADIQKLQQEFSCKTKDQCNTIVSLLQNDFCNKLYADPVYKSTADKFYFCCLDFSDSDVVLTGKLFSTSDDAAMSFQLLTSFAGLPESYSNYFNGTAFAFNLQLNLPTYIGFLQQITEDEALYRTRRDAFLNHLLARFAEQFTDFAMLSYGFLEKNELADGAVKNKEAFLWQYPLLSSNRGKAFDFRTIDQDKENVSGFEQRFKAYTGIQNNSSSNLCNFEVAEYEDTYSVRLQIAGFHLFNTPQSYEGLNNAQHIAWLVFKSIADKSKHEIKDVPHEGKFQLRVLLNGNEVAYYPSMFDSKRLTEELSSNLQKMIASKITEEDIIVSRYEYRLQLKDYEGIEIRLSVNPFDTPDDAFAVAVADIKVPNDTSKWLIQNSGNNPSGKFWGNNKKKPEKLIDIDGFKIDIDNNIVGKPDKYSYELLDKANTFKFRSLKEFDSENKTRSDCYQLLLLMINIKNYDIKPESRRRQRIFILNNGQPVAECLNRLESEPKAAEFRDKVSAFVQSHYYTVSAVAFPNRWKFTYQLGYIPEATLLFTSNDEFDKKENAVAGAERFNALLASVNLKVVDGKYTLTTPDNTTGALTCTYAGNEIEKEDNDTKFNQAKDFLTLRRQINEKLQSNETKPFEEGIEIDEISKTGRYVYRLVDKDRLLALHNINTESAGADAVNALYNAAIAGYQPLDICLGGDITEKYRDKKTKAVLYRYVIKCRVHCLSFEQDTVLFKSTTGYTTAEDAEAAFNTLYLLILDKAQKHNNYGVGKYISLDETTAGSKTSDAKNETIVFIPKETQALIPGSETDIINAFIEIAKSYPFKIDNAAVNKYSFHLYNSLTKTTDWESVRSYETIAETSLDFHFFVMLLNFKGNYFLETDYCNKQTIYIREVLAESTTRFNDAPSAWGMAGIEKFICIAQTGNAFHAALNNRYCTYNYFIACEDGNATHPCKYDSPEKRDEAIDKLYQSFKQLPSEKIFRIVREENNELLYGIDGKQTALIYKEDTPATGDKPDCERIIEILQLSATDENYRQNADGKYWLVKTDENDDSKFIKLAEPFDGAIPQAAWKEQLLTLAYYYPIKSNGTKYCIEIKLPGFNTPDASGEPCGCETGALDNAGDCYLSWQTACCFDRCEDAANKYESILPLLAGYDNYKPFFDCDCHAFGITLQLPGDIIAGNPQYFSTPDMVCDAIERSKKAINSEGLRLVEHILLRNRCAYDCTCNYEQRNFTNITKCEIFEKGIEMEKKVCFVPGMDPYSFIATVVLPAWPERFRKRENRDLLETIMNREAPAHILLRILWLKPSDVCQFEKLYKEWKHFLLQKEDCNRNAIPCTLKEFLFMNDFPCMSDCTDCLPCPQQNNALTCFNGDANTGKSSDAYKRLEYINDIFGWNTFSCSSTEVVDGTDAVNMALLKAAVNQEPGKPSMVPQFSEMTEEEFALHQQKIRFINGRLGRYKNNIARIFTDSNENPVAGRANFIFSEKNLADKINGLLDDLLNAAESMDANQALHQSQKDDLIKNLIWLYLDKMFLEENDISKINLLSDGFGKMRMANFDMQLLFNEWEPAEIAKYETETDINTIRQMLIKN